MSDGAAPGTTAVMLLSLVLLLASGCTLTTEWRGDGALVTKTLEARQNGGNVGRMFEWERGRTTLHDVMRDLGPPDELRRVSGELWCAYRHEYRRFRRIQITGYGGARVFTWNDGQEIDSVVIVAFDAEDRLAHHGTGRYSADSGLYDVLLD